MSNVTLTPTEFDEFGAGPSGSNGQSGGRRGLTSRLSFGHVLTAIAGVLTFFFLLLVLVDRQDPQVTVIAATERVDEGVPLTADLFEEVTLPEGNPLTEGAVTTMEQLDGSRTAQRDIPATGVLVEADFIDVAAETPGGGLRSLSIPIEPDKALGGEITDSDLVDILAVADNRVWIPAAGLEVLDDGGGGGSSFLGGSVSDAKYITMAVTADEAVAISFASTNAKDIYVVRSTGAERLPELDDTAGAAEVGVSGPGGSSSFVPADVGDSLNEALGGIFDDLLAEAGDE